MYKINNKIKYLSLGILAILALALMPFKVNAQRLGGYIVSGDGSQNAPTPIYYYQYQTPPPPVYVNLAPVYIEPAPTPIVYSSSTNPNPAIKKSTVAKAKTTTPVKSADLTNSLSASAVSADNGFMPSNLIQWLFFAILILLIVALVRKIYGGAEKYHALPMKHS